MNRYLIKIKENSIKDILSKITKKIYYVIDKYFQCFKYNVIEKRVLLLKRYYNNETRVSFIKINEESKKFYNENVELKNKVIREANYIIENKFAFLGSSINLRSELVWNEDFNSGNKWNEKYFKFINLNAISINEIKIPWEFSRLHFLIHLGKAYMLTNEKKYYLKFKEILVDWIKKNPYKYSVNWTCAMEVAIRAINIIVARDFFGTDVESELDDEINDLLGLHGKFIYDNLEVHEPRSNHYISDLVGLFWIGNYLKKDTETCKWVEFSIKELESEIHLQVNEDGTSYEASTSYHRLVFELFLMTLIESEKSCYSFSDEFKKKVIKMYVFLKNISKPNGTIPLIGDNDDGRLLILESYYDQKIYNTRSLLELAEGYLGLSKNQSTYLNEMVVLLNLKPINKSSPDKLESKGFSDAGFYVLRNSRIYCCIRCGELSMRGHGGHSHNDQLSVEINIDSKDILIDPGTYVYTSNYKLRNKFRSTLMHNTVEIDGREQNIIKFFDIFKLTERTFSKCENFTGNRFVGNHIGYLDDVGTFHRRTIEMSENLIIIKDDFDNECKKIINFIVPGECKISVIRNEVVIDERYKMIFESNVFIEDIKYSPSYGCLKDAYRIYSMTNKDKYTTKIEIYK